MTALPDALHRLHTALEDLARALRAGDPDAVLAAEAPIATAVHALAICDRSTPVDPVRLGRAVLDIRLMVARCHALGEAAGAMLTAMFPHAAYGPSRGAGAALALPPTLETRS